MLYLQIVKDWETYLPISNSCDSSCVLECSYSPTASTTATSLSEKTIHTPPPQYRGDQAALDKPSPFESRC